MFMFMKIMYMFMISTPQRAVKKTNRWRLKTNWQFPFRRMPWHWRCAYPPQPSKVTIRFGSSFGICGSAQRVGGGKRKVPWCAACAVLSFLWDKFNKRNWSQFVGIVPPKKYSGIAFRDYDLSKAEHRREMWELTSFHVVYVDILPPSAGSIRECLMDPHGIH